VVELQHSVPGAASAAVVRFSNGREAVWLTVDGEVHKGALSLIHVDAYRLVDSKNPNLYLDDLDLDSQRESAVIVIEWGGQESARLDDERLEIFIDRSEEIRKVSATGIGPRWQGFTL
jgi:tRNA threonylcarbamoyladenosine biosynthesis protein TsaE